MHTFRFNPVFRHWVLLGSPVPHEVKLTSAQFLHNGGKDDFVAAANPRQPFVMDPPSLHGSAHALYQEQPPVGEYEIFVYRGKKKVKEWGAKEWGGWLELAQKRLLHVHHNPHLHHVSVAFHLGWEDTAGDYSRVGELIATSHPVAGQSPLLDHDLVNKLLKTERGYVLHHGEDGTIYSPSAPLFEKEVWYIPQAQDGAFERITARAKLHTAEALALIVKALVHEWPKENFVLELTTSLTNKRDDATWWIRVYQEALRAPATLTVLPLPEKFVRDLAYLLGPGRVT